MRTIQHLTAKLASILKEAKKTMSSRGNRETGKHAIPCGLRASGNELWNERIGWSVNVAE